MKGVVVTGVSTGIGWGTAKVLIRHGIHVFGSVRKQGDAERLAAEFGAAFTPLLFDVTDEMAVQAAAQLVRERLGGETLFGLVNNAGIATAGPLMHQPIEEIRYQIEVNLIGQLIVTRGFLPLLGTDRSLRGKPGRIVNVSSAGGKIAAPFIGAYAASKHALEGLSESLRRELLLYGIDVIIVGPGAVATPIWDKAEQIDVSAYAQTDYAEILRRFSTYFVGEGRKGFPPERIGETILQALTSPSPRVRYAVVPQHFRNWTLPMVLPRRWIDATIARGLGLTQRRANGGG
ncbi:MAG TPA: SDR family NAD(P)-dependent oxidoreductase [Roseiflexaceae bacterium]|nr:SDR family NAD(P)-dependent oxidoreductase [Roseiflexaceae bacterium]